MMRPILDAILTYWRDLGGWVDTELLTGWPDATKAGIVGSILTLLVVGGIRIVRWFRGPWVCIRVEVVSPTGKQRIKYGVSGKVKEPYVSVVVRNLWGSVLRGCIVYLTDVRNFDPSGRLVSTEYGDSHQLIWSYDQDVGELDIPPKARRGANVVSLDTVTKKLTPRLRTAAGKLLEPKLYEGMLDDYLKHQFTVLIITENISPKVIRVVVERVGDELKACRRRFWQ